MEKVSYQFCSEVSEIYRNFCLLRTIFSFTHHLLVTPSPIQQLEVISDRYIIESWIVPGCWVALGSALNIQNQIKDIFVIS